MGADRKNGGEELGEEKDENKDEKRVVVEAELFVDNGLEEKKHGDDARKKVGEHHFVELEELAGFGPEKERDKKQKDGEGESDSCVERARVRMRAHA